MNKEMRFWLAKTRDLCVSMVRCACLAGGFVSLAAGAGAEPPPKTPVRRAEPVDPKTPAPPVKKAEPVTDDVTVLPQGQGRKPGTPPPKKPPAKPAAGQGNSPEQNLFDYANLCYGQKAFDLAAQQYAEYIRVYPNGEFLPVAWYRMGESYLNLNQVTEAENAYKQLIDRVKTGEYVGNAAYRLASVAYNKHNYNDAIPYFDIAANNTKQDKVRSSALYYKARCLTESGQTQAAYPELQKLAKIRENNPFWERAALQVARMDKTAKRSSNSLANYQKLADEAADPEVRGEAMVEVGGLQAEAGKTDEAAGAFQKALQLKASDPKSEAGLAPLRAVARYGLIELHYKAQRWQKVIETYQATEAVQLSESLRPVMWLRVGEAQRNLKQWRRAIDMFLMIDQYYPSTPENAEAGFRRLLCLNEMKDPTLPAVAEKVIERIKAINPNNEQIDLCRFLVAENYFVRQEYKLAATAYNKVRAEKIPEKFRGALQFHRGWSCAESGETANAIAAFSQFLDANSKDAQVPEALAKRGLAYKGVEDWKNAQADFARIMADYSESAVAELAYEQSALVKGQRKDVVGMIATFDEMLKKFPNSKAAPEAWFWIGSGRFDLKKYAEAVPALEKARQLDSRAYEKDAGIKIVLSYYYLQDLKNLVRVVDAERIKEGGENRVPRPVYQFLGLKHFELEDMPAADKFLTLASTPARPDDTDYRIWFTLSDARLANGRYDAALTAADNYLQKVDLSPAQKAKGLLNKATALYHLQRFDDAGPWINEALRLQPEARVQAFLRLLMGDIAMAKGEFEHAAQVYVVPSQMFDDAEITPLALWKTVQALTKAGKSKEADEYRLELEKRFPKFRPPPAPKLEMRAADI
jgi:TolA-binding protein